VEKNIITATLVSSFLGIDMRLRYVSVGEEEDASARARVVEKSS
jgi:hypothetical protein